MSKPMSSKDKIESTSKDKIDSVELTKTITNTVNSLLKAMGINSFKLADYILPDLAIEFKSFKNTIKKLNIDLDLIELCLDQYLPEFPVECREIIDKVEVEEYTDIIRITIEPIEGLKLEVNIDQENNEIYAFILKPNVYESIDRNFEIEIDKAIEFTIDIVSKLLELARLLR